MKQPLFVQTSAGLVNLALVEIICERDGKMLFEFNEGAVEVPKDEGHEIVRALRNERPEFFLAA